jgi:hypothetical protein
MPKSTTKHANTRSRTRGASARTPRRWTCGGCEVTVRYEAGAASPRRPEGWSKRGGRWLCLHCRRELAVEKATQKSGDDGWASRRQALVEFELRRSPDEPDGVIAKRANCSTGHVRKLRMQLREAGKLPKAA